MMMTPEEQAEFDAWVESRPEPVRSMIKAKPPITCYTLTPTGQHAQIYSYNEDGTITILTSLALGLIPVQVFGINPDDLTVCPCGKAGLN